MDAVVIVHGILPSYYLKQMAQTIIQRIEGIQNVMKMVEDRETDSCPWEHVDEAPEVDPYHSGVRHRNESSHAADHQSPAQPLGDGGSAMNQATAILEIEQKGEMLVVKPVIDLHDLDELESEKAVDELLEHMDHSRVTDVFLDLHGTAVPYSQAPRFAAKLWKRVRSHGGSMAIGLN